MEAMLGNPNQTGEPEAPSVKAGRFTKQLTCVAMTGVLTAHIALCLVGVGYVLLRLPTTVLVLLGDLIILLLF